MASPLFTEAFIIFRLNENGQPVKIIPFYTNVATYVAVSISMCQGMLRTSRVKDSFKNFTEGYDPELPKNHFVEVFINKIIERFPLVFIDDSLTNTDFLACHYRRAWDEDVCDFETRKQAIVINGPKVRDMCIAGTRAEGSKDPNCDESKRFRVFLFTFAKSLMHEIGHMFVTFLGRGKTLTPPRMYAPVAGSSQGTRGEAGQFLEYLIFGGRVTVLRNPAEGKGQAGICYLGNKNGTYQILQETIDKFTAYQFDVPISGHGPPRSSSMRTLGHGIPRKSSLGNPLEASETQWLLGLHGANPIKWDKAVHDLMAENPNPKIFSEHQESVMRRVPFEPSLLVEDPPNFPLRR